MLMLPVRFAFASVLLVSCLGPTWVGAMDRNVNPANTTTTNASTNTNAQAAPVQYWTPGWPAGFSDPSAGRGVEAYGNFPGFDSNGDRRSGFFSRSYSSTNDWSALNSTGFGLRGLGSSYASFGSSLYTEGSQFGYAFKNGVALYGGIDTLKVDRGSNAFAAFDSNSATLPAYRANAGIAFQPTANTTLSLGFSYTQQGSDRLDSDIRSPALPGETPAAFTSGRR
jgi:opacity protein-like surface antigen